VNVGTIHESFRTGAAATLEVSEQPGRELPSAHPPPRAGDARVALSGRAQGFLSAFTGISPYLRPRWHVLSAQTYRREMDTRFATCNETVGLPTAA
jgi:putative transposase